MVQKLILSGIALTVIVGIVVLVSFSTAPAMAPVINVPIRDPVARDRIITRINQEGIKTTVSDTGIILVPNENAARRMRSILIREDLIPSGTDPWAIFDRERWAITDFERNINIQRSISRMVAEHIKALDDVEDANVSIAMPVRELFTEDHAPVTASVIIFPKPDSDITQNRRKMEGIQKILKYAVAGLKDENIVISDKNGLILNNFTFLGTEFEQVIAVYNAALNINPNDTNALLNRGLIYFFKGDIDKAIADYTAVLNINPNNANALYNRGYTYYAKGDYDQAIADYTAVLDINPNYAALFYRGLAYFTKGDYDQAMSDFIDDANAKQKLENTQKVRDIKY